MRFNILIWSDGYFEIDTHLGLGMGSDTFIVRGYMEIGQWNLMTNT